MDSVQTVAEVWDDIPRTIRERVEHDLGGLITAFAFLEPVEKKAVAFIINEAMSLLTEGVLRD